ncbi:hypothetical protein LIER_22788 [Lithospermum erythrorhizon]|uniref:Uncharacterized protein n=1 Tax=Lithospermum erythrorhizon TaxID=34254 RepID=A0AAV3QY80_LITER
MHLGGNDRGDGNGQRDRNCVATRLVTVCGWCPMGNESGSRQVVLAGHGGVRTDAELYPEIHLETARVSYYDEMSNEQGLRLKLYILEKKRVVAISKRARYKDKVAAHYNKRVRGRQLLVGDLILRARMHLLMGNLES